MVVRIAVTVYLKVLVTRGGKKALRCAIDNATDGRTANENNAPEEKRGKRKKNVRTGGGQRLTYGLF
jgi:hypothetical protein